jgi:uncharacterized iron-regulated protein
MRRSALVALLLAGLVPAARADDPAAHLPIGDPARRDREVALVLDGITDCARGDTIGPAELAARLDGAQIVFVGESHTDMEFHRVQLRLLEELHRRGRTVLVGLEMYPVPEQKWLDRWHSDRRLTEERFLTESRWYRNWGYHWDYYRDIFRFARDRGVRMFAVNLPRAAITTVRMKGFDSLPAEQRAMLPPRVEVENAEHQRLFRAFFGEQDPLHGNLPDAMFQGMFRAQCAWDAAMGWNALQALKRHGDAKAIMVVLMGSGHVAYGLGAERQVKPWFDGRTATVLPIPIASEPSAKPMERVQASYADFVWGLPPSTDPIYPTTGLSTPEAKSGERYRVIMVAKGSPAEAAGFKAGDELVSVDGIPITDKEVSNRHLSTRRWGDALVYRVMREGQERTLTVHLRRTPATPAADSARSQSGASPGVPAPGGAGAASGSSAHPQAVTGATRPATPPPGTGEAALPATPARPAPPTAAAPAGHARHGLRLALDPERGWLDVTDTLAIPAALVKGGEAQFLLHSALAIRAAEPAVTEIPLGAGGALGQAEAARFFGINASSEDRAAAGRLKRYRVALPPSGGTVRLGYEGRFDFGLSDEKEQYTRGFRQTTGIVSKQGVYLSGDGYWYPHLEQGLVEFGLEVAQPEGWHVIAPGNGTSRDGAGRARWDSHGAVDEITVVGGPLTVYREAAGPVQALVYLRARDDALAAKYLESTAQYIEMYRGLIGPYPYGKFAMVENFWETGYGMPSYTLLGSQVIRFPFILSSSYPHEILHNWWGNSVFVDYASGNWCEGLTAYMADHLIQEQRGRGEDYRRDALQKYRNYVREGRDFPLREFRSRHSAATEAVGYGKTLMLFHMVRVRIGDEAFRRWVARFHREYRGRQASFADVRRSLEAVSGRDLARLFADQVTRPGAATLQVSVSGVRETGGAFEVSGTLRQAQRGGPFELDVPIVVQTAGKSVLDTLRAEGAATPFTLRVPERPLALQVDPSYDVFRLLDPRETPPSLGQIFGEPRILAVLPSRAPAAELAAYRALIEGWRSESHTPEIRTDAEVRALPRDRAVWLLGRENALAATLFAPGADYALDDAALTVDRETMPLAGHCAVIVRRHPASLEKAVGWIFSDGIAALPGLGRKLPHYGKYSVLGFEGDEPVNVLKGQWPASDSPLRVDLRGASQRATAIAALALPARRALAELPPVFSQQALMDRVAWLAAPEREGRGIGTRGLDDAAEYIAAEFKTMGLEPGGEAGGYFQSFPSTRSPSGKPVTLRNVIGVLRGSNTAWKDQSAVLSAHYDHLGSGWPDVHAGDEGRLHPGADDNASGVAVMLELARALAAGERPQRSIVFVAFTGEESGRQGSKHYVEHPPFPLAQTIGVINLDTVGRLFANRISVIATGTASEWQHIFRGAGFVTGIEGRMIPEALESSDQVSFIERGVPAVQIFTEPHADYHRPGDTAGKVDGAGLVKVATYVREGIQYLGERAEPLTSTIAAMKGGSAASGVAPAGRAAGTASGPDGGAPAAGGEGRRVTFGTFPDFAFAGPGVRVAGVTPGSPAEKVGVKEGDVLIRLDGKDIKDLPAYSALLRTLSPGQTVKVVLVRGGAEHTLDVTVVAR